MPRTVWKGAISFGLVNIPVALRAASRSNDLDFDWLDRRDMAPVGYQRINKRTGKPIEADDIVKGYQYAKGEYVLMNDEDFRAANPKATQTVDIVGFVDSGEIGPEFFETPYWLEAQPRAEKAYALLRDTLKASGRAGLASVVIHTKQHMAALLVRGPWLMLVTMRFADEVLEPKDLTEVPSDKAGAKGELDMAKRLVDEMTQPWDPAQYKDTYRDDLLARIDERVKAGQLHELAEPAGDAEAAPKGGAKVIDLMEALRASLGKRGGAEGGGAAKPAAKRTASADQRRDGAADPKPTQKAAAKSTPKRAGSKSATKAAPKSADAAAAKPASKARRATEAGRKRA